MKAYRISELERLGPFKRAKLYEEIAAGKLPAYKAGAATFVHEQDWKNYLAAMPRLAPTGGGNSGGIYPRPLLKKPKKARR